MRPRAEPASLNSRWMPSRVARTRRELLGLVDLPAALGVETDPGTVGAAALVGAAEASPRTPRRSRPAGRWSRPESSTVALRAAMSSSVTRSWSTAGTGSCHSCGSATHGPRKRLTGPMSRWSSLYQALAKASRNSSGFSRNRREITSYAGSARSARSVVSMVGLRFGESAVGPGMMSSASFAVHCLAPAGALGELPLVAEEDLEVAVAPLGRPVGPGDLEAAGDRVGALA